MELILLPGMDGTGLLFERFIERLPSGIEPMVIDYPATEPLSYAQLQALIARRLPQESDYVILGESFSGPLAIALAADSTAGLKGVILCCTFASSPRPLLTALGRFLPVSAVPPPLRNLMLLGRAAGEGLNEALNQALARVPERVLRWRISEVARQNVAHRLADIEVPVLALRATQDRLVPRETAEALIGRVKNGRVVDIEGPHMLLQANPASAAESVTAFVGTL